MLSIIARCCEDESGGTAVEYGLIAALIVIAMITALNSLADSTILMWTNVTNSTESALTSVK